MRNIWCEQAPHLTEKLPLAIDHVEDLYKSEEKGKSPLLNNADLSCCP